MRTLIAVTLYVCAAVAAAQQPTPTQNQPSIQRNCCGHRPLKRVVKTLPSATPQSAPQPASDFFVGEAKVDVTKDETVVRLAMAQHGSVLIELPANDGPRYIIPGDPEMATVDERALERNKRAIVVRPGSSFVAPAANHKVRTPAATVTAQMRSGLVVTFLFYPVEDLAQNVHRCVLSYNRDEVVARRRAAGLPVNLDANTTNNERRVETGQSTAPTISVDESQETKWPPNTIGDSVTAASVADKPKAGSIDTKEKPPAKAALGSNTPSISQKKDADRAQQLKAATTEALARATKKPKQFKAWTKPAHGIALSVLPQTDAKDGFVVIAIAIKNTSHEPLKLVSGSPDLFVEMQDDQRKPINLEALKKLHVEVSDANPEIPAGKTIFYAVAYVPPVLGTHQLIKAVVGQTNAADEPASITLTANAK
jgi:hypothetical protein